MDIKITASWVSERNEEHVIGNWRKGHLHHIVAESLAELHSMVIWKVNLVSNEPGYFF